MIQGIGAGIIPPLLDADILKDVLQVSHRTILGEVLIFP